MPFLYLKKKKKTFQEAEKMVAYLQDSGVDDDRLAAKTSEKPKPAGLPLTHEAALKWFYKDPQGEIQGKPGLHLVRV